MAAIYIEQVLPRKWRELARAILRSPRQLRLNTVLTSAQSGRLDHSGGNVTKAIKIASITTGGVFVLVVFISLIGSSPETVRAGKTEPTASAITTTADVPLPPAATTAAPTKPAAAPTTESKQAAVPVEHRSALKKAESYVDLMHMSKQGVYDQLTSDYGEKFSAAAAQYAVDNLKADWNAQALASAKNYQDTMHMSPSAIHDQLTSEYGEKFTVAEADYAIAHLND